MSHYNVAVATLVPMKPLLTQAAWRSAEPIRHISLVTPAMAARLPRPDQPLSRAPQDPIQARFVRQARHDPRRPAVVDKYGAWSYGELAACGNRLAHYLQTHGIGPGDIVAIYGHRDASLVWALLGVLTAGAAFLILDPAHPATRLIDCVRAARLGGWLCLDAAGAPPAALQADIAASSVRCRLTLPHGAALANDFLAAYASDDPAVVVGANDSAYVAFTSGSTGKPKGIVGLHGPVSHFLRWHTETFGLTQSDRFCMLAGLSHDPLLRDIFTPLWLGATLYIPALDEDGYDQLAAWMKQQEISVAHLTPPMARLLSALSANASPQPVSESTLTSMRWFFLGGDVLTERDVSLLRALAPWARCVNFYGATETPQAVGYFIVHETAEVGRPELAEARERRIVPLGQGIDNVQLLVLTAARRLAGVGEVGEIYVRTPYLSRGYLDDDALTAERFIANPYTHANDDRLYRTGDMARYRPDGAVEFLGRRDHQVKIRGYRINVEDIEAALGAASGVRETVVVAREDTPGERRLIAYIVAVLGADISTEALRHSLRARFPSYMVPAAFVLLDALPLTANGKLDRQALPAPDPTHRAVAERFVAPRTPTEEALAAIWADVLGIERAGALDNFFDLGGHSLLATRVVARARAALGVEVPLLALFRAATLADFATDIEDIVRRQGQLNHDCTPGALTGALTHQAAARTLARIDTLPDTDVATLLDDLLRG